MAKHKSTEPIDIDDHVRITRMAARIKYIPTQLAGLYTKLAEVEKEAVELGLGHLVRKQGRHEHDNVFSNQPRKIANNDHHR